ncbi:thioredoxin-disulfide reductase [Lentisphaerota bacterium ZTH]|nr:thioredoxin-disulfide reductase [Lentisphaerota bacterium]WET06890.1 thioredoxin-disulfide reductase [Lentisphaerota bacterium ZTH]
MENIVIVGSGAAGLTAAIYASRANLEPVVVSGVLPGGLLTQTSDVENYPGFPAAVNGFELMMKFEQQAKNFGTKVINDIVTGAELKDGGPHKITLKSGEVLETKALIIATGASPRWLGLESEEKLKNKGVSACATCDGAFFREVPVVVVGGGDTAMEEAIFLTKFASKVYVVHRRDELRASKIMGERAQKNPKIEFLWSHVVTEIIGEEEVEGVKVKSLKDDAEKVIEAKGFFAALGHIPNNQVFNDFINMDKAGYIKLDDSSSKTNIEGVFAAGDCADHVYRQAITAAGMGCRAAIDAERWLEAKAH